MLDDRKRRVDPFSPPGVTEEMLTPEYWLERTAGAAELLLTKTGLDDLNSRTFQIMHEQGWQHDLYQLEEFPTELSRAELLAIIAAYSGPGVFPAQPCYNQQGRPITESEREAVLARANLAGIPPAIRVKFGILLRREDLRAFPTKDLAVTSPDLIDHDLFQLTSLSPNSPVAVLHHSTDGKWSYVQSTIYRGWLRSDSIAITAQRAELFDFLRRDSFLTVSGAWVETEPNPFDRRISNLKYQMGDQLPLAEPAEVPDSIPAGHPHGQAPIGNYVIKVPIREETGRDETGALKFKLALIRRRNDLQVGYLPYTRANLLRQAFKMLGERYGWGGSFGRRDCSRFVLDIYRSVGVILPRDANRQEVGTAGRLIRFSGSVAARKKQLAQLAAGDPLYLKGHVMVYLGRVQGKDYVIHDGAGYAVRKQTGKIKAVTVHGVFVMELEQLLTSGKQSYLEALTIGRSFK